MRWDWPPQNANNKANNSVSGRPPLSQRISYPGESTGIDLHICECVGLVGTRRNDPRARYGSEGWGFESLRAYKNSEVISLVKGTNPVSGKSRDPPVTLLMTLFLASWAPGARDRCGERRPGVFEIRIAVVSTRCPVEPSSGRSGSTELPPMPRSADVNWPPSSPSTDPSAGLHPS
jgi:hypothetical protein